MKKLTTTLMMLGLLLGGAGCSQRATTVTWQKTLEHYAANQENGDFSFLRNHMNDAGQRYFAVIGGKSPDASTDVTGVLLGRRNIQDKDWYVFLVGTVKKRDVEDIRIALLSDDSNQPQWVLGREDNAMLAKYRQSRTLSWRASIKSGERAATMPVGFPNEDDEYRLDILGNTISIIDDTSGARWTLVWTEKSGRK